MQSEWSAFGLGTPADNMILADVYVAYSVWVLVSPTPDAIPGMPTVIHLPFLPAKTAAVRLWSQTEMVWYAVGESSNPATPGPIPAPLTSAIVPDDAFVRGDVLKPGQEHICALPEMASPHALTLVSAAPNALVLVTALTQIV